MKKAIHPCICAYMMWTARLNRLCLTWLGSDQLSCNGARREARACLILIWCAQTFVSMLNKNGQRWVPILDPPIHIKKGYTPYDNGVAGGVFVTDITGKPYVGQVRHSSFLASSSLASSMQPVCIEVVPWVVRVGLCPSRIQPASAPHTNSWNKRWLMPFLETIKCCMCPGWRLCTCTTLSCMS